MQGMLMRASDEGNVDSATFCGLNIHAFRYSFPAAYN